MLRYDFTVTQYSLSKPETSAMRTADVQARFEFSGSSTVGWCSAATSLLHTCTPFCIYTQCVSQIHMLCVIHCPLAVLFFSRRAFKRSSSSSFPIFPPEEGIFFIVWLGADSLVGSQSVLWSAFTVASRCDISSRCERLDWRLCRRPYCLCVHCLYDIQCRLQHDFIAQRLVPSPFLLPIPITLATSLILFAAILFLTCLRTKC